MMKRAVLYCRVSTKEQEKGNSLDWQEEYLRKCCAIRKYEVVKVFRDDKSGKTFKGRTEFINLMKYCKAHKGEIDYVLVYRWDRYSRNLKEALINLDYFWKKNIEVNSVEQQDSRYTRTHFSRFCGIHFMWEIFMFRSIRMTISELFPLIM